ncbi:MAG: arsenate reductase [Gammaproteobacteria bacterium]|nr:arsenate reductase [Gammaproteobacteria bacterium]
MYKRNARVLFLGMGHFSRSSMAQGWVGHLGTGRLEARAADIEPQARNPAAMAVMREAGVDMPGGLPVHPTPALLAWADLVISVCPDADKRCPALPAGTQKRLWRLSTPDDGGADEESDLYAWRTVRDEIRSRIEGMIGGMNMLERMDRE